MKEIIDTSIQGVTTLATVIPRKDQGTLHERRRRRSVENDECAQNADTEDLREAADKANDTLAARGSPYRFYIEEIGEDVLIHLKINGGAGGCAETILRTISKDQFSEWITHLETGEGVLFDMTG